MDRLNMWKLVTVTTAMENRKAEWVSEMNTGMGGDGKQEGGKFIQSNQIGFAEKTLQQKFQGDEGVSFVVI